MWAWFTKTLDQSKLLEVLQRENEALRSKLATASIRASKLEERMKKIAELSQ